MEGGEKPITDICLVADRERTPLNYVAFGNTVDGKRADFAQGRFNPTRRYLAYTTKVPSPLRGPKAVVGLRVLGKDEELPSGFLALTHTHDTNAKVFSSKVLAIKLEPYEEATSAVTKLQILSPSKKEDVPFGFTRLPEINGFSICYKMSIIVSQATPQQTGLKEDVLLGGLPQWWTECPKCPKDVERRYHLVDVKRDQGEEWSRVTHPFTVTGFTVRRLQRVQNLQLYRRLQFEKQSMTEGKPEGYRVNERLLFHTTSANMLVICREGLDQRLAMEGRFGTGVYFSDNPKKCDFYWRKPGPKKMFACCVLLGTIKEYPRKQMAPEHRREPKGYDSVKGNVTGEDEYIIYNYYRAMPAYVVEYM